MAEAGGVPAHGGGSGDAYYKINANNVADVMQQIADNAVLPRSLQLSSQLLEGNTFVLFGNDPVPVIKHPDDGWSYEAATKTLNLNGAACDTLKANNVDEVTVAYGCYSPGDP